MEKIQKYGIFVKNADASKLRKILMYSKNT